MKRNFTLVFTILLFVCFVGTAMASDKIVTTSRSNVFLSYGSGIGHESGLIMSKGFSNTLDYYNQTITVELQKYTGGSWTRVTSWTVSEYDISFYVYKYYQASPGLYRTKSTHTAGGETVSSYSNTMSI